MLRPLNLGTENHDVSQYTADCLRHVLPVGGVLGSLHVNPRHQALRSDHYQMLQEISVSSRRYNVEMTSGSKPVGGLRDPNADAVAREKE